MSVTVTMLKDLQISSPYHSFLSLNRGGFSEESSCQHFDPFRYIVREASHPIISAMAARSRRNRQEYAEYFNGILPINTIIYTTSRSCVAHNVRVKSGITPQPPHISGRERFAHPVPRYLMFRMPPCIKWDAAFYSNTTYLSYPVSLLSVNNIGTQ